ncbi:MAG: radical SAM protein [Bacillota bacterium]
MASITAKRFFGKVILRHALNYAAKDPEKNLLRVIKWGERLAVEEEHRRAARTILATLADPDNNWTRLIKTQLRRLAPRVREKMVINFFLNAALLGIAKTRALEKVYGVHLPWVMLIDPTGRCNLRCKGCWAGEYDRSQEMDFATLDRILKEGEDLGIYFIVVSGGEPTLRMDDLLALARKHGDAVFHVFTNGTLIDEKVAASVAELGNITFAISLEGLEEATDARRGRGVFARVMQAMDHLRTAGVLFGFSATYTRENAEEIGSDRFIDLMIEKGCAYGWLFTYVPVGGSADLAYMATPEQRARMYQTVRRWRQEKPIFVADFWNDGEAVEGCIAGGRCYSISMPWAT